MAGEILAKLIVLDTGPLITLAAANSLDYLLYPGVPIYLPDAVLYEATRDAGALGATEILAWAQGHSAHMRTVSTQTFFNFVESRTANPARREKDLGERAAIEAIHDGISLEPHERAILVSEDDRVLRRVLVIETELTDKMIPMTTRDLLEGLEAAQHINSAEAIYQRAEDARRPASRRAVLQREHERAWDAVERLLRQTAPGWSVP